MVGFIERPATGYTIFNPGFQKIGGDETIMADLVDTSKLTSYVDEVQIYNPDDGLLYSFFWVDGTWTDYAETSDILIVPGKLYFANFMSDTKFRGEVVNSETLRFEHHPPQGYSLFGSAFPVPLKQSNFNFAEVMTAYVDEVQVYNPDDGLLYSFFWDGVGFTDYSDYLPDEIAPIGEGVMLGNIMGFETLIEDINPKAE